MDTLIIVKLIALFVAIWFTMINIAKLLNKSGIPAWNLFFNAAGVFTFVVIQFKLW